MLIVLFSFLLSVSITLQVMQIDFERLEQLAGFDIYNSSLRVRKYNRTAVALNGTIHLLVPLNESIMVCKFLENFYTDYSEYVDDFENLPAKGECPIKPCKIDILNKPFPAKAVPPFFPS
ncbi:uncharacterized protein LOC120902729 isoform X2 [Anopheles arabiensis]|uniref:uncharacterized protein LOC120902729 isoform X2 n=1 Tax=Anopheles arabiensis TaxID=7173 RepID=UPI001AAD75AF|nr:uncharacterized protein LOC120902729 isoform X2 [Anopheles arabiensis]